MIDDAVAIWQHADLQGGHLLVMMAVAEAVGLEEAGVAVISIETVARRARLERRRTQQVLRDLARQGVLAVDAERGGRGLANRYRVLLEAPPVERKGRKNHALSTAQKGENIAPFRPKKGAINAPFQDPAERAQKVHPLGGEKGAESAPFPGEKGAITCAEPERAQSLHPLGPQKGAINAPFPPPDDEEDKSRVLEVSSSSSAVGVRTPQQELVGRVLGLLTDAGLVRLPSPSQIGLWAKHLGGTEALVSLTEDLIGRGLAGKDNPAAYMHSCVQDRRKNGGGGRGRARSLSAGSDATRRRQLGLLARAAQEEEP